MAKEKFIRGKHDSCKHDGLYSIRKREQAADYELKNWQEHVMEQGVEYTLPTVLETPLPIQEQPPQE